MLNKVIHGTESPIYVGVQTSWLFFELSEHPAASDKSALGLVNSRRDHAIQFILQLLNSAVGPILV